MTLSLQDMPVEWRKFKYRGYSLEELLNMPMDDLINLLPEAEEELEKGSN